MNEAGECGTVVVRARIAARSYVDDRQWQASRCNTDDKDLIVRCALRGEKCPQLFPAVFLCPTPLGVERVVDWVGLTPREIGRLRRV